MNIIQRFLGGVYLKKSSPLVVCLIRISQNSDGHVYLLQSSLRLCRLYIFLWRLRSDTIEKVGLFLWLTLPQLILFRIIEEVLQLDEVLPALACAKSILLFL